ncbi:catalase [Dechloromonas denitrificans]|uniref:catalase n=1 Tax=Dechloromonas denitrificans TaxID=281362 RepID=UPI001CFBA909|nr:catalase [Dechloromonas denitrificans]UCV07023.1 catalase [Dechloromonas denitrificans]
MFRSIAATCTLLLCFTLGMLSACSEPAPKSGTGRTGPFPALPPTELGEKWSAENEAQADEILSTVKQLLEKRYRGDDFLRRDAHPKHHGCVKASFTVDSRALPRELQVGIFAATSRNEFPAWVRFSNGSPDGAHSPDIDKDIRGMAVKLMNFEGTKSGSHDFVMLTSKEFITEDGEDYLKLHRALNGSNLSLAWYFMTHWKNLGIVNHGRTHAGNPLQLEYFSSVPYKLGPRSMKFKARPCASNQTNDPVPADPAPNYLRERLVNTLKSRDACFEFLVQPNMDPDVNDIEQSNLAWDEGKSPFIKVATITIPRQLEIDSSKHLNFCENLSFDPWRSLPETRPLGQINRMRFIIYPEISRLRHAYNNIPVIEPRSHDICVGQTAPLCEAPKH